MEIYSWDSCEAVVDADNEFDTVAARECSDGIEVAYMSGGFLRVVTIAGIFAVCPLVTCGVSYGDVQSRLEEGSIAVPVITSGSAYLLTIDADGDISAMDNVLPSHVYVVSLDEGDPDSYDEDLTSVLNIV